MCWSYEVSVMTGAFSYLIALYLWLRNLNNDRWLSIVIFVFSTIQWCDAILWKNLDNDSINKMVTHVIPFIFALEPLSVLLGAKYVGYNVTNVEILIYIIYAGIIYKLNPVNKTVLSEQNSLFYGPNSKLPSALVFLVSVLYPIIKYYPVDNSRLVFISVLVAGWCYSYFNTDSFSSNWCLYSNLLSAAALMSPYIN